MIRRRYPSFPLPIFSSFIPFCPSTFSSLFILRFPSHLLFFLPTSPYWPSHIDITNIDTDGIIFQFHYSNSSLSFLSVFRFIYLSSIPYLFPHYLHITLSFLTLFLILHLLYGTLWLGALQTFPRSMLHNFQHDLLSFPSFTSTTLHSPLKFRIPPTHFSSIHSVYYLPSFHFLPLVHKIISFSSAHLQCLCPAFLPFNFLDNQPFLPLQDYFFSPFLNIPQFLILCIPSPAHL